MLSGSYLNKHINALDFPHVGHVVREVEDKIIIVFGGGYDRYDIPKESIKTCIYMKMVRKYKVSRPEPLPAGESVKDL